MNTTTKLEQLRASVNAHFATYDAYVTARAESERLGYGTLEFRRADDSYNSGQHKAMILLRDLLPLLDAVVAWDSQGENTGFDESVMICDALSGEVAKLLTELEVLAS